MATEKYFVFSESGELKRMKGRIVRFLDNEDPTGSDKSAIRTSLEVSPDAEGLVQADIGTAPNEIPVNGMLGDLAYQSAESVSAAKLQVESTTGTATTQALTVTDGSSTNFVVQEDGSIGVGNSAPDVPLDVSGATAHTEYAHFSNNNQRHLKLSSYDVGGNTNAGHDINASSSVGALSLSTGGTQRVRIDSSGRLGVNQTAPSTNANSIADDLVVGNTGQASGITVVGGTGSTSAMVFGAGGTTIKGGMVYDHPSNSLNFSSNGATRWLLNSSGNLQANGAYGIDFGSVAGGTGTPTPTVGGLLDDFERGSFTPSFTSTGTAPTLTYLSQVGTYTKVGNLVTCHGRVRVNAVTGAGTGSLQISGLPFATQNVANLGSGGAVCLAAFFGTSSSGCPTHISGGNNATVMTLKTLKNSAGVVASLDNTDAADLAGNCYVDFSVTYTTS